MPAGQALPAQQVEVVARRRRHGHGHVVLCAQRQEPLYPGRGVVGPLAVVAVRQQQHHAGTLAPLLLTGADELVHDRLAAVEEVPELGLPADQRVRARHRVAVLEAHRGELGQQRVVHEELGRARLELLERRVLGAVVPVHQHRVPLAERAAPAVLADQPHRVPVEDQRAERQHLAGRPVDGVLFAHGGAPVEQRLEPRVRGEVRGQVDLGVDDPLHGLGGHRGRHRLVVDRAVLGLGPDDAAGLRRPVRRVPGLGEDPLELLLVVAQRALGLLHGDVAAGDQRLGVHLPGRPLGLHQVVHERLGERRVVGLVVPPLAVADHVHDDVLLERLPVGEGQPGRPYHGLRVVPVDVENGRLDHPGHVGRVHAGPRVLRRGGEAHLVVHDDVHGAAGPVAAQQ